MSLLPPLGAGVQPHGESCAKARCSHRHAFEALHIAQRGEPGNTLSDPNHTDARSKNSETTTVAKSVSSKAPAERSTANEPPLEGFGCNPTSNDAAAVSLTDGSTLLTVAVASSSEPLGASAPVASPASALASAQLARLGSLEPSAIASVLEKPATNQLGTLPLIFAGQLVELDLLRTRRRADVDRDSSHRLIITVEQRDGTRMRLEAQMMAGELLIKRSEGGFVPLLDESGIYEREIRALFARLTGENDHD